MVTYFGRSNEWAEAHFFVVRMLMSFRSAETESQVREIAERVAASAGLELVDAEWKGGLKRGVLQIYIDKPGGVTHGDCETVSRQLSAILDVEDLFPYSYNLEVSSPGLDRKLSKPADFERFAGRKATFRLRNPFEGSRRLTARIEGHEEGRVALATKTGSRAAFALEDIEQARLVVEI